MARTVRDANLETRTARIRLPIRSEPYWRGLERGFALGRLMAAMPNTKSEPRTICRTLTELPYSTMGRRKRPRGRGGAPSYGVRKATTRDPVRAPSRTLSPNISKISSDVAGVRSITRAGSLRRTCYRPSARRWSAS